MYSHLDGIFDPFPGTKCIVTVSPSAINEDELVDILHIHKNSIYKSSHPEISNS